MLTQAKLRDILWYDPETGVFIWLRPPKHNSKLLGKPAGNTRPDGYTTIRINGEAYYAHRLAFLYMTGQWPEPETDHIDRNPFNDRWSNLREATSSLNKYNQERNV